MVFTQMKRWFTLIALLSFAAWVAISFPGCSPEKKKQVCWDMWGMPSGAICSWREIGKCSTYTFSQCDDGREYLNPDHWQKMEKCK